MAFNPKGLPAFRGAENPKLARRRLVDSGEFRADLLPSGLAPSWLRSWNSGLQPTGRTRGAPHASAAQLKRALELQHTFVTRAQPTLDLLATDIAGSGSMVILADAEGMVLRALGDLGFAQRAERVALRAGANWNEQYRGTNAVGTALVERRHLVVNGHCHFLERNGFLTCTAAPVFSPSGMLLGAVDVSGDRRSYHPHTLALVRSAARAMEHSLFDAQYGHGSWPGVILHVHPLLNGLGMSGSGKLAVREDGQVIGACRSALGLLGAEGTLLPIPLSEWIGEPPHMLCGSWNLSPRPSPFLVQTRDGSTLWMQAHVRPWTPPRIQPPTVQVATRDPLQALDTGDSAMHEVLRRARQLGAAEISLLILGESGTGKEILARAIHASSPRAAMPFVAVNCASLPEALIEAELFGYARGAFTGAAREGSLGRIREADHGVLFLDEIGDMPLALQARLLRVLEDKTVVPLGGRPTSVDFRLFCATHRDLESEVAAGRFRQDLLYRINGFSMTLPALRERRDLDALITLELKRIVPDRAIDVDSELAAALRAYSWPGNLRQLAGFLRTACALREDHQQTIGWEHTSNEFANTLRTSSAPGVTEMNADLRTTCDHAVARCLEESGGNIAEAARRLGISRNTLYRKLRLL